MSSLTPLQLSFLEFYFEVHDPLQPIHPQDFSRLQTSQVILIGNIHVSKFLKNLHVKLLTQVIGHQKAYFPIEGLAPGQNLPLREVAHWHHLPEEFVGRGADMRFTTTTAAFLEIEQLQKTLLQLRWEDREHSGDTFRKISTAVKAGLLRREGSTTLWVDEKTLDTVAAIYDAFSQKQIPRLEEILSIDKRKNQLASRTGTPRIEESNLKLFEEIEKACKEFPKVIALWGAIHFHDQAFLARLQKAHISYVILLPKKHVASQALEENRWLSTIYPVVEMTLRSSQRALPLRVPQIFYPYFFS